MKTKANFYRKRKKVDFGSDIYNKVQDLCFEVFGERAVIPDIERDMISVISPVSLSITFSRNETKMYFISFFDCNKSIIRAANCNDDNDDFNMCQCAFRVFAYEEAEKYILFKKTEGELIKSIEG